MDPVPAVNAGDPSPKYSSRSVVMSNLGNNRDRWMKSSQPGDVGGEWCRGLVITAERDESFLATKVAEMTEESQKYSIVFFRVVRVFRGYLSRWLRAGCRRNQPTAIVRLGVRRSAATTDCVVDQYRDERR
ncbi:MAG: hypothetical protein JNL58_11505 [Planctomyces sp.]|nr:hypothetical protein [Planctomyces sp.]